jgi:iron-sulfur cluster biosynthesis transcriptional regulator SufR
MQKGNTMLETTAIKQMPATRRKILELLKRRGPLTADQLAEELSITSMGVRQHLVALERDELIKYFTEQRGKGRPSYVYAITTQGDELFPRSYPQLVNSFLDATREAFGEDGINQIFSKRNDSLEQIYSARLQSKSLEEKVAELAQIRTEEGYMAEWEQQDENTFLIHENNCAICQVAERCQNACTFELELFKRVLPGTNIVRDDHIMSGNRKCTYIITAKD